MTANGIEQPITRRRLLAVGVAGGVSLLVGCGSAVRSKAVGPSSMIAGTP